MLHVCLAYFCEENQCVNTTPCRPVPFPFPFVSPSLRGRANLLCIVQMLTDDHPRESNALSCACIYIYIYICISVVINSYLHHRSERYYIVLCPPGRAEGGRAGVLKVAPPGPTLGGTTCLTLLYVINSLLYVFTCLCAFVCLST